MHAWADGGLRLVGALAVAPTESATTFLRWCGRCPQSGASSPPV